MTYSRLGEALQGSQGATAYVQGMKIRARLDPPKAAEGSFPYAHRSCAEWFDDELSEEQGAALKAKKGSKALKDAIARMAA